VKADGAAIYEPIAEFNAAQNSFVALPIDLGPDIGAATDQVILALFGTGWRNRTALSAVNVSVGGTASSLLYAGEQPTLAGVDQINVRLPRTLIGRGLVNVVVTVDRQEANTVQIAIR